MGSNGNVYDRLYGDNERVLSPLQCTLYDSVFNRQEQRMGSNGNVYDRLYGDNERVLSPFQALSLVESHVEFTEVDCA